jgi:hypothetical protein
MQVMRRFAERLAQLFIGGLSMVDGLIKESERLERERMEIHRKRRDRDDRGRKYALLCQKKQQKQLPLEE